MNVYSGAPTGSAGATPGSIFQRSVADFAGDAVLQLDAVCHTYPGAAQATLVDIGLTLRRGEIAAILGRSGSGKSTLLHIAAGLTAPNSGQVIHDGEPVKAPLPTRVLMLQEPALYPWMTAVQNAALGLRFQGQRRTAEERARATLRTVQLEGKANSNVQQLSGGQQQRVALARALAPEPDLLLLDEPFSGLDPFTRWALQRDVRGILRRLGLSSLIVTHDLDEALVMADRVFVMTSGPGHIAGETSVDLSELRERSSPAFREAREALVSLFETTAGERLTDEIRLQMEYQA